MACGLAVLHDGLSSRQRQLKWGKSLSDDKCFFGNSSQECGVHLFFSCHITLSRIVFFVSKMSKDKGEIGRWSSGGQKLYSLQKKSFKYIILRLCRLKEIEEYTKIILIAASPLLIGFARMSDVKCYPFTLCSWKLVLLLMFGIYAWGLQRSFFNSLMDWGFCNSLVLSFGRFFSSFCLINEFFIFPKKKKKKPMSMKMLKTDTSKFPPLLNSTWSRRNMHD
jgi:hypothetical protein